MSARDRYPSRPLLAALVLVVVFQVAVQLVPLPPPPDLTLASTFGVHDNRRLLLRYAALVVALCLAPWLSKPPRTEALGIASARSWARSLLFALPFGLAGAWIFFGPGIPMSAINGHEMVHLGYLSQMRQGAVLNVDTFMNYGPLLGTSVFGFMKAAGFHLVGFRWYWHTVALLTWFLLVGVAWRNVRSTVLVLVLALYALVFTALSSFLPDRSGFYHAAWGWANPLRHGGPALCIIVLAGPLVRGRRVAALVAGSFVTATTFYAQETGLPALLTLGALAVLGGRWKHTLAPQLAAFGVGLLAAFPIVCLPALARGEIVPFLRATFEAPRLVLEGAANKPFPALDGFPSWPYYLLPFCTLGLFLWHGIRVRSGSRADALPWALAGYGSIAFVTVLVRADRSHLQNVALSFWMLLVLDLDRILEIPRARPALVRAGLLLSLVPLLVVSPGGGALVNAIRGRMAHPAPPAGWSRLDIERGGIWVPGDRWFEGEPEKHGDLRAVVLIHALTDGRPTQILGSQASLYYFLSGARAAVPYTDLTTQCVSDYHRRRLIAAYFRNKPEYTFLFTEFESHPPRPATGYRRLGERYGLGVYQREDLLPVALPE